MSNTKSSNTAVVLAGGKSSRLNFDKQTISINGVLMPVYIANCLSQEFEKVIIGSNKPELYSKNCPYEIITDNYNGLGPKAGILAGLENSTSDFVYFTGCDMPYVNIPFIRHMRKLLIESEESISVVLAVSNGYFEPLNAFYSQDLKSPIRDQLNQNRNKLSDLYQETNTICIGDETLAEFDPYNLMFVNLNTPEDYKKLISWNYKNWIMKQNL